MAENTTTNADEFLDPYEKWMADSGIEYDLPRLQLDDDSYLSGVIEFSTARPLEISQKIGMKALGISDGHNLVSVWRGAVNDPFLSKFLPVILPQIDDTSTLRSIKAVNLNKRKGEIFSVKDSGWSNFFTEHIGAYETAYVSESESVEWLSINDWARSMSHSQAPSVSKISFGYPVDPMSILGKPDHTEFKGTAERDDEFDTTKPLIIVAIIDDGIPFAHENFRCGKSGKSRIDYCWNQSAPRRGDVAFGAEFLGREIDELVGSGKSEDAIYRDADVLGGNGRPLSSLAGVFSHGAHVLDTMSGKHNIPEDCQANIRIIAVDLPVSSSWDTSGFGKDMFILSALHYIFGRADKISKLYVEQTGNGALETPLIVNLSYGFSGGPHDGTTSLERAMNELIEHRQKCVGRTDLIMPSGNMFHDKLHAVVQEVHLSDGTAGTLPWRISANDRTSSFLEIWLPPGVNPGSFNFRVISPSGLEILNLQAPSEKKLFRSLCENGQTFGLFSIDQPNIEVDDGQTKLGRKFRIAIILAPTESTTELPTTESGLWDIEMSLASGVEPNILRPTARSGPQSVRPGDIECWIQRDVSYGIGNTGAKQSFFDDPLNKLYWKDGSLRFTDTFEPSPAYVRRYGSLNGMSTFNGATVVGGYVASTGTHSPYSSAGSLRADRRGRMADRVGDMVNLVAPTDRSPNKRGVLGAGTRSGIIAAMNGTSVAAPQVASRLSLRLLETTLELTRDLTVLDVLRSDINPVGNGGAYDEFKKARLGEGLLKSQS